jgi:hypothetical protein
MYHNTNKETGQTLATSNKKAKDQEEIIMSFMQHRKKASPEEIWMAAFDTNAVPLTSVRRGVTNLTNKGKLVKTEQQIMGMYGKMISIWEIV